MTAERTTVCLVLPKHKTQEEDKWERGSRHRHGEARPKRALTPSGQAGWIFSPIGSVFLRAFSINVDRFYGRKKERKYPWLKIFGKYWVNQPSTGCCRTSQGL